MLAQPDCDPNISSALVRNQGKEYLTKDVFELSIKVTSVGPELLERNVILNVPIEQFDPVVQSIFSASDIASSFEALRLVGSFEGADDI